jgi:hypothetical protein
MMSPSWSRPRSEWLKQTHTVTLLGDSATRTIRIPADDDIIASLEVIRALAARGHPVFYANDLNPPQDLRLLSEAMAKRLI